MISPCAFESATLVISWAMSAWGANSIDTPPNPNTPITLLLLTLLVLPALNSLDHHPFSAFSSTKHDLTLTRRSLARTDTKS